MERLLESQRLQLPSIFEETWVPANGAPVTALNCSWDSESNMALYDEILSSNYQIEDWMTENVKAAISLCQTATSMLIMDAFEKLEWNFKGNLSVEAKRRIRRFYLSL